MVTRHRFRPSLAGTVLDHMVMAYHGVRFAEAQHQSQAQKGICRLRAAASEDATPAFSDIAHYRGPQGYDAYIWVA